MSSKEFGAKTFGWLRQVNADKALRPSDAKIVIALTRFFAEEDQDGRAFPSCLTLADDAGLSQSTVVRGVRRIEAQGHLKVIWGQQGSGHANQYWMIVKHAGEHVSEPKKHAAQATKKHARRSEKTCLGAYDSTVNPSEEGRERDALARATTPLIEKSEKEERAPPAPANDNPTVRPEANVRKRAFENAHGHPAQAKPVRPADTGYLALEQIWSVRPWIDLDHGAAWSAYQQAAREATLEAIVAGARRWVSEIDAPRYLPSLAKWLAARGWLKAPPQRIRGERAARSPSEQGGSKIRAPEPGSAAEAAVDRVTDQWNAWARARGANGLRWLSDDRAGRCVKLIERLGQLYPDRTPEQAFAWLLGICSQSFFVRGAPKRPLEFWQLLDEEFFARMIEGTFRYTPKMDGRGGGAFGERRPA